MNTVVVNSTPLIALSITGHLNILRLIFADIMVPYSVYEEVVVLGQGRSEADEIAGADWLNIKKVQKASSFPPAFLGLDQGEMEVLQLAQSEKADWVLIDEKLGRKVARTLGLKVKGTLGVLLTAYKAKILSKEKAERAVDILSRSAVRLSSRWLKWFQEQIAE